MYGRLNPTDFYLQRRIKYKLIRGLLDLIILIALRENEMSGYEIISFIYDTFNVLLSPGTVYPLVQTLNDQGLIEIATDEKKKTFRLSKRGEGLVNAISIEYLNIQRKVLAMWGQSLL